MAILRYSGRKRRQLSNLPEDEVMLLAMRDMNLAKLTSDDLPLFNGITRDLFPGVQPPTVDYSELQAAIETEFHKVNLQVWFPFNRSQLKRITASEVKYCMYYF